MTAAEYLKYGTYLCKYYEDKANDDCSDECPFHKRNQELYKSTGKWSGAFCVFPEFRDNFDLDFALAAVEEFKRKLERVCPKDLFGKEENLIRVCADNNNVCDKKCWDAVMESKILREVENIFNN